MLGYLSIREMAARTGLSEERIRQLIRTHQITEAIKLKGWWVKVEDFETFLKGRVYRSGGNGSQDGDGTHGGGRKER